MGSNIHGLGDLPSRQSSSFWNRERSTAGLVSSPYETSCIEIFFPGFTVKSFILWTSVFQTVVYIATLIVGSSELRPNGWVLYFRFLWGFLWSKYPAWAGLEFNVFFQMRMGLSLESSYGLKLIALLYFVSGVAGNLLSVAIAPCKTAVGASTAGFGLIGIQMAEMALCWHMIQHKDRAIFNIIVFVVISVMLSVGPGSTVDWRGHLGGFIVGFALGIVYNQRMENRPRWYKTGMYASMCAIIGLYISCMIVIFAIPMEGPSGRCS